MITESALRRNNINRAYFDNFVGNGVDDFAGDYPGVDKNRTLTGESSALLSIPWKALHK